MSSSLRPSFTEAQQRFMTLLDRCTLPVMAAPMFLVSGPELVIASAKAGILGAFPAPNARNVEMLDDWLRQTTQGIEAGAPGAPWALNMIVHSTYDRFDREMELVKAYRPPVVSTALGSPKRVLDAVHGYGGIVMADVASPSMARKAAEAGADVLILVANGAGGHTGQFNPFALVSEVRSFWQGPLGLAGAITSGRDIRVAQLLGADFAVAGTRFIPTQESLAQDPYRALVVRAGLEDLVLSKAVSGVAANWFRETLEAAGIDPKSAAASESRIDFSGDISAGKKAWKDVWSAGHGVGGIRQVGTVASVVDELHQGYFEVLQEEARTLPALIARHTPSSVQHAARP